LVITFQGFTQTYPVTGIIISLPANPDANIAEWSKYVPQHIISVQTKMENGKVSPLEVLIFNSANTPHSWGTYAEDNGYWKHCTAATKNLSVGKYKLQFKSSSPDGVVESVVSGNFIDSMNLIYNRFVSNPGSHGHH
jgi:hypothetical protein